MTLPDILSLHRPAADRVVLSFHLPADLPVFAGHFPGRPILAGVFQLDWAMRLAGTHLGLGQRAALDFQVKFRRLIQAGDAVTLHLHLDRANRRLGFEFRIGNETASVGRVKLEELP